MSPIQPVTPTQDSHDRLWAEIDVLDDVSTLAQETTQSGFFGAEHSEAVDKLRKAQATLVDMMLEAEKRNDVALYKSVWENSDIVTLKQMIFDADHIDAVSKQVNETTTKLDEVAKCMDDMDQENREAFG
uniref:ARAD1D43868p n=1 Tax=Blastobotrys adeninivorans TaxID=409370 RepID=A0A060TI60_BLAAD